jgi:CHAT domain-containing protein
MKLELTRLQRDQPELASLVSVQPSTLPQLQEAARRRHATIVEYFSADERLFIWVIGPDGTIRATSSAVKRPELERLIQVMRRSELTNITSQDRDEENRRDVSGSEPLAKKTRRSKQRNTTEDLSASQRLYRTLIEPISTWLPEDPNQLVTIIPHGPLFLVSFAALPDRNGQYLVERNTINYCPSISLLRFTGDKEKRVAQLRVPHMLVVGNPAMPRLFGSGRALRPLPGAEHEAHAISRQYPPSQVTTLVGSRAEERLVRELAPGQAVIHLATHGVIRDDEPLESFLVLAPRKGGKPGTASTAVSDGPLTVREVFQLDLNADLVVLSACNTGLGRINGDGVIGLSRAFVYAGTPSVIVSLWRVADIVARFEMEQFYSELKRNGGNKAAALRQAQVATLTMLRHNRFRTPSGKPLGEHPLFWAPFVLIGEAL